MVQPLQARIHGKVPTPDGDRTRPGSSGESELVQQDFQLQLKACEVKASELYGWCGGLSLFECPCIDPLAGSVSGRNFPMLEWDEDEASCLLQGGSDDVARLTGTILRQAPSLHFSLDGGSAGDLRAQCFPCQSLTGHPDNGQLGFPAVQGSAPAEAAHVHCIGTRGLDHKDPKLAEAQLELYLEAFWKL